MTLAEALKVNGKATSIDENGYVLLLDGRLYRQYEGRMGHPEECSFERSIKDIWEPYVKPCAHDPAPYIYPEFENPKQDAFYMKCKHCGPKIRATGWEVV